MGRARARARVHDAGRRTGVRRRGGERYVAGIGLGNEPDISYGYDLAAYLADLAAYRDAGVTRPFAIAAPSTSETIAPWQSIEARAVQTRFFWDWPAILDTIAPALKAVRGAFGTLATDHFYPLARGCATDEYRCATIERAALRRAPRQPRLRGLHARRRWRRRGLDYRLQETGTAAGRGVDGVSNVAASATWALAAMFETACPQPPNAPGRQRGCATGAVGINLHNAEVNAFFAPEEGNAFYNAIAYDPSPAAGAPSAAPGVLRAAAVRAIRPGHARAAPACRRRGPRSSTPGRSTPWRERRVFLINLSAVALTAALAASATARLQDRPHDAVRPDGRGPHARRAAGAHRRPRRRGGRPLARLRAGERPGRGRRAARRARPRRGGRRHIGR